MKVKKFRIKPRFPSVGKNLKALMGVRQIPIEIEETFQQENDDFLKHTLPSAFYNTWSHDEIPASFLKALSDSFGIKNPIAVSAVVASIGHGAEEYLSQFLMNGETTRSQVITAFAEEATELSMNFIFRLLSEDAEHDDCVISDSCVISDHAFISEILGLLEANQEGISLDQNQHLSPRFTKVALSAWWPASKKRKAALPQKKKSA